MSYDLKNQLEEKVQEAQADLAVVTAEYANDVGLELEPFSAEFTAACHEVHVRLKKANEFLGDQEKLLKAFRTSGTRVFLDLETTGLEDDDDILQVGVVITDDALNILAEEEWLVPGDVSKCNDFVTNMHTHSGLFHTLAMKFVEDGVELTRGEAASKTEDIAVYVHRFIIKHCPLDDKGDGTPVFCNNSVQFDERFLRNNMPYVLEAMHYRRIDISTMRRVYRDESKGAVDPGKPACPHTALGDARVALQEYKDLNAAYREWVVEEYLKKESRDSLERTRRILTAI